MRKKVEEAGSGCWIIVLFFCLFLIVSSLLIVERDNHRLACQSLDSLKQKLANEQRVTADSLQKREVAGLAMYVFEADVVLDRSKKSHWLVIPLPDDESGSRMINGLFTLYTEKDLEKLKPRLEEERGSSSTGSGNNK